MVTNSVHLARGWQLRLVMRSIAFPLGTLASAMIPGVNALFWGHGGFGWLFGLASFPWFAFVLLSAWFRAKDHRPGHMRLALIASVLYVTLTYPLGRLAESMLVWGAGEDTIWIVLNFPLSLLHPNF
jgi:hypothetical protein